MPCLAVALTDNWQVNGFVAQSGLHTDGNNYFGDSEHSLSPDFFEAGLVTTAHVGEHWSASAQVLSRRAGNNDNGSPDLDYAFVRYRLPLDASVEAGFKLGRIQLDQGLYNATRDVPFTRPSILLPQSLYGENIRNSRFAHDGIQLFGEKLFDLNRLRWSLDYYKPISDGNETDDVFVAPVPGDLDGRWSWSGNAVYEWSDGQGSIGLAYDKWRNTYSLDARDIFEFINRFGSRTLIAGMVDSATNALDLPDEAKQFIIDTVSNINATTLEQFTAELQLLFPGVDVASYVYGFSAEALADITSTTLSASYDWPAVSIAAEYLWRTIETRDFGLDFLNERFDQRGYYLQAVWHASERWDLLLRFDDFIYDRNDRTGDAINMLVPGVPGHRAYARDITLGATWHLSNDWMARLEWHNIEGTAWIPAADNADDFPQQEYWNLVALQLAWRF